MRETGGDFKQYLRKTQKEMKKTRVERDARRTLPPIEIQLLIKINRKRGMRWLIAPDEPIFTKPAKRKEQASPKPCYGCVIRLSKHALSITFCPIMCLTQHFAVLGYCFAAFTPC